ncbi:hypothetical protein [Rhizobium wenxiniae]|uniref:hypothetical protein n=1 Tax=Rhizobium wenxiniae TaxID=1737357 RepID=UPI003C268CED
MKLGELRSAIRKTKGNPIVKVPLVGGTIFTLTLQKTPLLEELEKAYPGGKGVETGLSFVEQTGLLRGTGGPATPAETVSETTASEDDVSLDLTEEDNVAMDLIRAQLGETGEGLGSEPEGDSDDDLLV